MNIQIDFGLAVCMLILAILEFMCGVFYEKARQARQARQAQKLRRGEIDKQIADRGEGGGKNKPAAQL